ncbi:hypothetical protein TRFO_14576 [Tritrichomonas foetus]|uniref:Alpha-1,2-Mannosidase n=1 Tax=Tritrichomonas foetus TaxID=1144522 RepID=A0A1J4KUJ2_9EUKA|nr:hypothetical protein TRFO_14576 [Tritrichomonas foetus]|eukprot:OHT14939.1 hypothetical protein TRFO_14576 [Tritrichomonas foetus]
MKKTTQKFFNRVFVLIFIIFLCTSFSLLMFLPTPIWSPKIHFIPKPIPNLTDSNEQFFQSIINACIFAFNSHFENCKFSDEFLPSSKQCRDTFGFYSTIIESIETIYLMHLENLSTIIKYFLQENFDCSKIGWVNRREFWSRLVGSFIGSYHLSHDPFYLYHAEKCASLMMNIEKKRKHPFPFININESKYKKRIWTNGTSLNEISVGIPEFFALFKITKNQTYINSANRILKTLPTIKKEKKLPEILSIPRGFVATNMRNVDILSINFYRNLAIANNIQKSGKIVKILENMEKTLKVDLNVNFSRFIPLLDTYPYSFKFANQYNLKKKVIELYSSPEFKIFKPGSNFQISGFTFEADSLRIFLRDVTVNNDIKMKTLIMEVISESLNKLKIENGYSGISHSNSEKFVFDKIQHSNFISQWLKVGILLDRSYPDLVNTAIFNEKGHILSCDFMNKKSCDL